VLLTVTLPRTRAMLWGAALWVALQAAGEITVTYMTQVLTLAQGPYTAFAVGNRSALSQGLAASLPFVVIMAILVLATIVSLQRRVPALPSVSRPPLVFSLGAARWPVSAVVTLALLAFVAVPLAGLVWKTGSSGYPEQFYWSVAAEHLQGSL